MDVVTNAWFQTAVVGGALIFGLTRYLRPKTAYKTDWVKDVVYLYQFPRLKFIPSISPFALKVETWLRLKKITYESIEGTKWSRGGKQVFLGFDSCNCHNHREIAMDFVSKCKKF